MEYNEVIYNYLSTFCTVSRGKPLMQIENTPYIEIDLQKGNFAEHFIQSFNIYLYGTNTGFEDIDTIVNSLEADIGESGKLINEEGINVKIYKGSPFCQDRQTGIENLKAVYVNLEIEILKETNK